MIKHFLISAARLFSAGGLLALGLAPGRWAAADGVVPHRFLVHVDAQNDADACSRANGINHDYSGHTAGRLAGTNTFALQFPDASNPQDIANALGRDSRVLWVEADTYVAAPEVFPAPALPVVNADPFHFPFDITSNPKNYRLQKAYKQINLLRALTASGGQGITIAILDTGAVMDHPALQGHLIAGFSALSGAAAADEAADGAVNASMGHGTMIAGLVAALAPGAAIMPVRVLNGDGVGTAFTVAQGIQYAAQHGAKVINLSLTSATPSQALAEAINQAEQAGILVVAAAGNGGGSVVCYPAAYPGVLAVSSVDADGSKSEFANYGAFVSVVAPGSEIASAYLNGLYASGSGTSFAAPFAAVEAVLLMAANPRLTPQQARWMMTSTAQDVDALNPLYAGRLGAGLINIDSAVLAARAPWNPHGPNQNDPSQNDPYHNGKSGWMQDNCQSGADFQNDSPQRR